MISNLPIPQQQRKSRAFIINLSIFAIYTILEFLLGLGGDGGIIFLYISGASVVHGIVLIIAGCIFCIPFSSRKMGRQMVLAGIPIFIVGAGICFSIIGFIA